MAARFLSILSLVIGASMGVATLSPTPALARGKEVTIYVNGTDATGIKDFTFKAVDVRIDSDGNVWIDAPRYRIAVKSAPESATTAAAPASTEQAPAAVEPGHHWLVTQDAGSTGQVIEVLVNGALVREIRSGQAQLILDIGEFLKPGSNVVTFRPIGTETPGGGALSIHLGEGTNEGGTLKMQNPQISYTRTGNEPAGEKSVEYVVKVRPVE